MTLYSTFPPCVYTLRQFVQKAEQIKDEDEDLFLQFVVTGQATVENPPHQVVIDPIRDNSIHDDDEILITRDYDSFLGITNHIVVDSDISIYPVSNPSDTLTTSIHLKYPMQRGDVSNLPTVAANLNLQVPCRPPRLRRITEFPICSWGYLVLDT
jgi:hypothetical protein